MVLGRIGLSDGRVCSSSADGSGSLEGRSEPAAAGGVRRTVLPPPGARQEDGRRRPRQPQPPPPPAALPGRRWHLPASPRAQGQGGARLHRPGDAPAGAQHHHPLLPERHRLVLGLLRVAGPGERRVPLAGVRRRRRPPRPRPGEFCSTEIKSWCIVGLCLNRSDTVLVSWVRAGLIVSEGKCWLNLGHREHWS